MDNYQTPVPARWAARMSKRARSASSDSDCEILSVKRAIPREGFGDDFADHVKRESSPECVLPCSERVSESRNTHIKEEVSDSYNFSTSSLDPLLSVSPVDFGTVDSSTMTPDYETAKLESSSPPLFQEDLEEDVSYHEDSILQSDNETDDSAPESEWENVDARSGNKDIYTITDGVVEDDLYADILLDQKEYVFISPKANEPLKPKKKRRSPARTPLEYFQRLQQDRREKLAGRSIRHRKSKREHQMEKEIFQNLTKYSHIAPNEAQHNGPFPEMTSGTKKDQMDKLLGASVADMRKNSMSGTDLAKAFTSFGLKNVKAFNGKWLHKKMTSALLHYQLVGVSRMLECECCDEGVPGGILADVMGLGKTVETIALIVANPPPSKTPFNQRTTLIIVPKAVLYQWQSEIQKHAGNTLVDDRVMIYKASADPEPKAIHIHNSDIVLTTYHQVSISCPFPNKKQIAKYLADCKDDECHADLESFSQKWISDHKNDFGLLHRQTWYRVVIDEGHAIKNHKTRLSNASHALKANFRWILSGTPVMNGVDEFFSIFRFLKHPEAENCSQFINQFCNTKNKESRSRLYSALASVMIRRTLQDTFLGRPLVQLPNPHSQLIEIKFTAQERILYRALEGKCRELINAQLLKEDPRKSMTFFVVQLLRLRQCTSHPLLIEHTVKDVFSLDELTKLEKKLQRVGSEIAARIPSWIKQKKKDDAQRAKNNKVQKYEEEFPLCPLCGDLAEEPHAIDVANCHHIFCETCIKGYAEIQLSEEEEDISCPRCKTKFLYSDITSLGLAEPEPSASKVFYKKLRRGQDSLKFIPDTLPSPWLALIDTGYATFFKSAKLRAAAEQLSTWSRGDHDGKMIVFVQWRQLGVLFGRHLEDEGTGFVHYTGDMNSRQRSHAVSQFRDRKDIKIMVAGMKCGGLGLNLAFANKVIIMDLWWNICLENQAFGRVHRLGQEKETYFARIIVHNSVDRKLLALQEKKVSEIGSAMGEKLTPEEMMGLFGRVLKDTQGNIVGVEADYSDDEDVDEDEW